MDSSTARTKQIRAILQNRIKFFGVKVMTLTLKCHKNLCCIFKSEATKVWKRSTGVICHHKGRNNYVGFFLESDRENVGKLQWSGYHIGLCGEGKRYQRQSFPDFPINPLCNLCLQPWTLGRDQNNELMADIRCRAAAPSQWKQPAEVVFSMLLWCFLNGFQACPTGEKVWGRPRNHWRDYVSHLVWELLQKENLEDIAAKEDPWKTLLSLLPPQGDPERVGEAASTAFYWHQKHCKWTFSHAESYVPLLVLVKRWYVGWNGNFEPRQQGGEWKIFSETLLTVLE